MMISPPVVWSVVKMREATRGSGRSAACRRRRGSHPNLLAALDLGDVAFVHDDFDRPVSQAIELARDLPQQGQTVDRAILWEVEGCIRRGWSGRHRDSSQHGLQTRSGPSLAGDELKIATRPHGANEWFPISLYRNGIKTIQVVGRHRLPTAALRHRPATQGYIRSGIRSAPQDDSSTMVCASRSAGMAAGSSTHSRNSGEPLMRSMASRLRSYS